MRRALAVLALGTGLGGCARTPARLPVMPATGTYAWGEVRDLLPETVGMIALIPIPDSLLARV
ncbi:MAG: hypothetical protein K2X99_11810, partial [Gemmatimonadaceae bacterium]|nr:hypothetical protein [Gemmatimonadaceae bacterium]